LDWRGLLRSAVPWLVAAALIAYVFSRVPIEEAWLVARNARPGLFVLLVFGGVIAWFLLESLAYAFLFTRFNAPVSFKEARSLRGMSYLLTPTHWNVGKAAVILRLRQTKEIPVLESTSSVMLYQGIDGAVLATFATLGLTLLSNGNEAGMAQELSGIRTTTAALASLVLFNIVSLRATWPRFRLLNWWRGLAIHHAHRSVGIQDVAILIGLKGSYHFLHVLVFYYGTAAFGIDLPFPLFSPPHRSFKRWADSQSLRPVSAHNRRPCSISLGKHLEGMGAKLQLSPSASASRSLSFWAAAYWVSSTFATCRGPGEIMALDIPRYRRDLSLPPSSPGPRCLGRCTLPQLPDSLDPA
jgi:hypothetical protein